METVRHDGRETAYRAPAVDGGGGDRGGGGGDRGGGGGDRGGGGGDRGGGGGDRGGDVDRDDAPILYVHGSGGTHQVWVHQYGRGLDRPGVALDLSGHGESDDVDTEPGPATLDAYATDVLAVVRETGARVLCGNSLGGAVVQHVALEHGSGLDALDAIVLSGTGAKLGVAEPIRDLLADDFEGAVEALHADDLLFHDPDPDTVAQSQRAMRDAGQAVVERDFLTCHRFDVRDRLSEIDVPTLAITGEHDRLTPVSYHEYLADLVPTAECTVVEDAAHLSFLERPDAWNAAVAEFLDRTLG